MARRGDDDHNNVSKLLGEVDSMRSQRDIPTLREVMRLFPQGVVIVTANGEDGPRGITVSAFTSVSLMPPLVVICILNSCQAYAPIMNGRFVVNILGEDQGAISDHFAKPNLTSEQQCSRYVLEGSGSIPHIDRCLAYIECKLVDHSVQGDHTLFIGGVESTKMGRTGRPLIFWNRNYHGLESVVQPRE